MLTSDPSYHVCISVGEQSAARTLTLIPGDLMEMRMRWCHKWKHLETR
jgi:hypothetical protein